MELRLSEVLSALSHALDITEGQPRGHAERTCLIGMRIGTADRARRGAALLALLRALLKDAGCSSNAAKVAALYGDADAEVKRDRKTTDHLVPASRSATSCATPRPALADRQGAPPQVLVAHGSDGAARADRAALRARGGGRAHGRAWTRPTAEAIARTSTSTGTAAATRRRWRASEIPLLGRILCLAQTAEVFWQVGGARRPPATWRASGAAPGSTPRWSTRSAPSSTTTTSGPRSRAARRRAGAGRPRARLVDDDAARPRRRGVRDGRRRQVALHGAPLGGRGADRGRAGGRRSASTRARGGPVPRRAAARHRQARRLQPDPRQARQARRGRVGARCAATRSRRWRSCAGSARFADVAAAVGAAPRAPRRLAATTAASTAAQLDLAARVLAVADVAEALTARAALPRRARPGRGARDHVARGRDEARRRGLRGARGADDSAAPGSSGRPSFDLVN